MMQSRWVRQNRGDSAGTTSNRSPAHPEMRRHISNAAFGVLDYVAYPLGMLAIAPLAFRALGIDKYGVWTVATAAISAGAIIASGFGDANIRIVAVHRATGDRAGLLGVVRCSMAIHLVLGAVVAAVGWILAPLAAHRVVADHPNLFRDCVWSFRLTSLLMLLRSVESVCVSTQRAFARYGAAVQISLIAKLLSLVAAATLPFFDPRVSTILLATLAITICALGIQVFQIGQLLETFQLSPWFEREAALALLSFGSFTWLQAVCGLVVGQADRMIAGFTFGAAAAASYGICAQLAQPIWGIVAAGLHFLFPYLATQQAVKDPVEIKRTINRAVAASALFIVLALVGILVFGVSILRVWGGEQVARVGQSMLPTIALSTALSASSVVGSYAMLALGCARTVTCLTLAAAATMFLSIPWLAHIHGVYGIAEARLLYGPIMLLVYIPLFFLIRRSFATPASARAPICEEA